MKRLGLFLIACLLFCACEKEAVETTAMPEPTAEVTILTLPETTEVPFVETTVETTEEITTEVTTKATTKVTEAAPKAPEKSPAVKPYLDGEYEFGEGVSPVIENIDGFTYVNGILIVNKTYSLPEDFNPGAIHPEVKAAFDNLAAKANENGINYKIISGFRPYSQQYSTYNNYAKRDGQAAADRYSARAGHSEHQSGLALDINTLQSSFGETREGKWLAENCAEFGFIIRYGKGKEESTGFMYEPWHIRYVGKDIAKIITESDLSLEEFLGITSVYPESE